MSSARPWNLVVVVLGTLCCNGGSAGAPGQAPSANQGLNPPPKALRPCTSPRTAEQLRAAARSAAQVPPRDLTALWPQSWPPRDGGVVFWTTDWEPLPSGHVSYRIRGPTSEIRFASLSSPPDVRRIDSDNILGKWVDFQDVDLEESLPRAEQAMVDIIAGCRELEAARADLQPYLGWLEVDAFGKFLKSRSPAFIAWLKGKDPGETRLQSGSGVSPSSPRPPGSRRGR